MSRTRCIDERTHQQKGFIGCTYTVTRPLCQRCERNVARLKGYRVDGSPRYGTECSACRKKRRRGESGACLPVHEHKARMQIGPLSKERDRLISEIASLRPYVDRLKAIKKRVKKWEARQRDRARVKRKKIKYGYKRHKKDACELCGFVAKHSAQLDVDHIDGNGANNDLSNLQTLCANCHRLKTMEAGDHLSSRSDGTEDGDTIPLFH